MHQNYGTQQALGSLSAPKALKYQFILALFIPAGSFNRWLVSGLPNCNGGKMAIKRRQSLLRRTIAVRTAG
jgi:hypothetical protein